VANRAFNFAGVNVRETLGIVFHGAVRRAAEGCRSHRTGGCGESPLAAAGLQTHAEGQKGTCVTLRHHSYSTNGGRLSASNQANREGGEESARLENEAHINWYRTNGYKLEIKK